MPVKIVTDSVADIPADVIAELGISIIPILLRFGEETYRDGIDITTDQFYERLVNSKIVPTTAVPSLDMFARTYARLAEETDEILVITLSSKLSGTYNSAIGAKDLTQKKCRVEVIDSETVALGLGLITVATTRVAQSGAKLDELTAFVRRAMNRSHFIVYFDTLEYLAKGGRIGKAKELMGALLSVKQILTVKDGEMAPLTRKRSMMARTLRVRRFQL